MLRYYARENDVHDKYGDTQRTVTLLWLWPEYRRVITPNATLYFPTNVYRRHRSSSFIFTRYVCDDDDEMDVMWCVFVSHCHTDYMDIKWINMKSSKNVTIFMLFCLFRRTSVSATSRLASHRCAHTYGNNKWSMRKKKMLFERCCHF